MFTATVILAVLVALGFGLPGLGKLMGHSMMEESRKHLGVAESLWKTIGGLELLGGIGVIVGLHSDLPIVGVLAAIGLVGMSIGAVYYHQKAGDEMKDWMPAIVMGSLAIIYIILRIGSA